MGGDIEVQNSRMCGEVRIISYRKKSVKKIIYIYKQSRDVANLSGTGAIMYTQIHSKTANT